MPDTFQYIGWKCPFSAISQSSVACVALPRTHITWNNDENLSGKELVTELS